MLMPNVKAWGNVRSESLKKPPCRHPSLDPSIDASTIIDLALSRLWENIASPRVII